MVAEIQQIVDSMPAQDRLLLLWVYEKCRVYDSELPPSRDFMNNVILLRGIWNEINTRYPGNELVANVGASITALWQILNNIQELRAQQVERIRRLNALYARQQERQEHIDKERISKKEAVLLPLHFPFSWVNPLIPKREYKAQLPQVDAPSDPFVVGGITYQYVRRTDFARTYYSVYRTSSLFVDLLESLRSVDAARLKGGMPILLPYGFRLWGKGIGWDGFQATLDGRAPVNTELPDIDIEAMEWWTQDGDNLNFWFTISTPGESSKESLRSPPRPVSPPVPSEMLDTKGPLLQHNGRNYQYVDVLSFIDSYHIPARIDHPDPWWQACIPFFDAAMPIVESIIKAKPEYKKLIELIMECNLDDDTVLSFAHSRVPQAFHDVVNYFREIRFTLDPLEEELGRWVTDQMPAWGDQSTLPLPSRLDMPTTLFTKIYRLFSTSKMIPLPIDVPTTELSSMNNEFILFIGKCAQKPDSGGQSKGSYCLILNLPGRTPLTINVYPTEYFCLKILHEAKVALTLDELREKVASELAQDSEYKRAGAKSSPNITAESYRSTRLTELRKIIKGVTFSDALYLVKGKIRFDADQLKFKP